MEQTRAELRRTLQAGEPVGDELVDALILPLVDQALPEWQATLDAVLALPEVGGPVGYSGGVVSIGIRLAAVDSRIAAAGLFANSGPNSFSVWSTQGAWRARSGAGRRLVA